jgi:hypothetical protein
MATKLNQIIAVEKGVKSRAVVATKDWANPPPGPSTAA